MFANEHLMLKFSYETKLESVADSFADLSNCFTYYLLPIILVKGTEKNLFASMFLSDICIIVYM